VPRRGFAGLGWRVAGALAIVYVVWGSTYLAIRVLVETVPPLLSGGVRFLTAGALLYAWVRWRRPDASLPTRGELAAAALVGALLVAGGNGLVAIAEQDVPSGLAALIIASEPLWVMVLRGLARERLSRATLAGVVFGFAGVALLLAPGQRPAGVTLGGLLLVVLAAVSWASGSVAASRLRLPRDPLRSTALQMLFGGLVATAIALATGEGSDLHLAGVSVRSGLALAYLVVFGSLVAFTAYAWLLQNAPISTVSTYAYVNPVIAVTLGWAILSEPVGTATLAGAAIVVASVAFTVRREGGGEAQPESAAPAAGATPAAAPASGSARAPAGAASPPEPSRAEA
jgi:drug/metabolite transporter (DMT)-like permease